MDTITQSEGSVGKKLLQALWTELRLQSPRFEAMNEAAQGEVLDRLRAQVDEAVREAVGQIAASAGEFHRVRVTIDQVTFKEGAKIVLKSLASEAALHVASEVGSIGMLVLCDPEQFVGDMDEVKPTPNQADLVGDGD